MPEQQQAKAEAQHKAEQLGDYLKKANADRLLHDVEDFRREPAVLAGGALALGFAASRFLEGLKQQASAAAAPAPAPCGPGRGRA